MSKNSSREVPLDQWQVEEQRIPTYKLEIDRTTKQPKLALGERVIKQRYKLTELIPHQVCSADKHYYELVNGGRRQDGRVLVKCKHCSLGRVLIPGRHRLEDGKLLPFHPPIAGAKA